MDRLYDKILRPKEVSEKLGIHLTTLWRLSKTDHFPDKIQLSKRAVGYSLKDLDKWLQERSQ